MAAPAWFAQQVDRRAVLRGGAQAFSGLSLPVIFPGLASAAPAGLPVTGKSVVLLFMQGGPSQIETFDPKMSAGAGIRSTTGEISTSIPGVTFGATFPKLASLAHRLAIVRSFTTGDANHDIKPVVGRNTAGANLGSFYSRIVGPNDSLTGLPTNTALFPQAVNPQAQPAQSAFGRFDATGGLGAAYAPFQPGGAGDFQKNLELKIPADRLQDRRSLLSDLDRLRYRLDRIDGLEKLRDQAFRTILGGGAGAFDLNREDPRTIARYDTAPLMRPDQIASKWNNHKYYVDHSQNLGRLMLLARRMCEAGCGFVLVTTNFVWDMHADSNNAGTAEGMGYVGRPFDHAVSAFLEDVEERGLSEKILLVCCGEMGRTPRLDANGGRNHWGSLAPLLLSGGGLNMGQVIGQSTRDAGEPLTSPVGLSHLTSTILHTLVDVGALRLIGGTPKEILQAAAADPIPELGERGT